MHRLVSISLLAALLLATACSSWAVSEGASAPAVVAAHDHVRILKTDGTVVSLENAMFQADSIIGTASGVRTAISTAEVKKIAVRKHDGEKTAGLVIVGVVVGGVVLVVTTLLLLLSSIQ